MKVSANCWTDRKEVLSNGLRIVTAHMPHTRSVTIAVFVGAGSRHEAIEKSGVFHFIEHMCFKGTTLRATPREVSGAIEGVGGILNAATDKELSVYWCKVALPYFPLALDVLSDMICHSKFDLEDIESERRVIIEEINLSHDSPQCRVDLLVDEILWPNHPLGRDIAGCKETVSMLSRIDMCEHLSSQYVPNNTVIAIAGNVEHSEVVSRVEDSFGEWRQGCIPNWNTALDTIEKPSYRIETRDTEQVHLCLAVKGPALGHPDRFIFDMLNVVLGQGMSSRLFMEIRERLALAYAIYSSVDHFLDSGCLGVYAGVSPSCFEQATVAILGELSRLRDGVSESELVRAKELCKGQLALRMEDSHEVASWLGGQELLLNKTMTMDEATEIVESISLDQLRRVARDTLVADKLNLAAVGPIMNGIDISNLLKL
ncbi:MAG: pitrilysin family protein [Chloroflexota bacterium]|nr:pitrilysin family protein [Chloroflexota bacterium]